VKLLVEYLPERGGNETLRNAYNKAMAAVYDEVRDFIVLHYILSQREEPFWRDSRNVPVPDSLQETLALYNETGRISGPRLQLFLEQSYFFILAGNGRLPRRPVIEADVAPSGETWHVLETFREQNRKFAMQMPAHAAYMAELHHRPV
jgi:tryptophan 7-halogenase